MRKLSTFQNIPQVPAQWQERIEAEKQRVLQDPDVVSFLKEHQHELAPNAVNVGMTQLMTYVAKKDNQQLVPGYQPYLIVSQGQIELSYEPTASFYAQKQEEKRQNSTLYIDIPKSVRHASFSDLYIDGQFPNRMDIVNTLLEFVRQYVANPHQFHKGLYLYGEFGVGKTYLMGAMVNELAANGVQSMLLNTATLISKLRQTISQPNGSIASSLDRIKTVPVLVLDDIGMETMTEWSRDEILGVILQYRMQEELPTFFTSNLSMEALSHHLSETKQSTNTLRAGRLMERIRYLANEVKLEGVNLRHEPHQP